MADVFRLNKPVTWKCLILYILYYLMMLHASDVKAALLSQSHRKNVLGNDRYELSDGSTAWCLFCSHEDYVRSKNIKTSCYTNNEVQEVIYYNDTYTNALYCYGIGKQPKCNITELPAHTHIVASDPGHLYYTHTHVTVSCETGFRRKPPSAHSHIILQCNGNPPVWNSSGLDFQCVINSTSHGADLRHPVVEIPSNATIDKTPVVTGTTDSQNVTIIIGVLCGVCALISGVLFCWCLHKRRISQSDNTGGSSINSEDGSGGNVEEKPMLQKPEEEELKEIVTDGVKITDVLVRGDYEAPPPPGTNPINIQDNSVETPPRSLEGDPDECTVSLCDLERWDNGKVQEDITSELNLDKGGCYRSWIGLGKTELGLTDVVKDNIRRCYGTDVCGPASDVITRMRQHDKKIGHLIRFLHVEKFDSLRNKILHYHQNCPYCSKTMDQSTTVC